MKNLAIALEQEIIKNNQYKTELINDLKDVDLTKLDWRLSDLLTAGQKKKQFTLEQLKEVLTQRLNEQTQKRIDTQLKRLQFADLPEIDILTINVEWKRSQMWGSNPNANAYISGVGNVSSGSIGGCGYDKQSTAVANVLNQVPQFLKLLYEVKNQALEGNYNDKEVLTNYTPPKNNELFGYGSGYGVLPYFEGGVGVSCYYKIFEKIGYKFETVSSGKMFDVYRISKI